MDLYKKTRRMLSAFQLVKKHACGGFFDDICTVCLGASAPRAANGDRNPLLRKGSETTGRVNAVNRGVRTAR